MENITLEAIVNMNPNDLMILVKLKEALDKAQEDYEFLKEKIKFSIWRVEIPEDMQLVKYSCDNYSTTDDQRLIRELSPVRIIISWNGKWRHLPLDCDAETEWRREHEKWVKSLHELGEKAYRPLCDN